MQLNTHSIVASILILATAVYAQEPIETTVIVDDNEIKITIMVDAFAIGEKKAETGKGVFGSIGALIGEYPKTSILTAIIAYKAAEKNNLGGWFSGSGGDNSNLTGNDADAATTTQTETSAPTINLTIKGDGNTVHISEITSGSQTRFDSANE